MAKQRPRVLKSGISYTPAKTKNYETLVKEIYITQVNKWIEGQIKLEVNAYFSIPKSASKRKREAMLSGEIRPVKRPDWDNIGKIISDALNGIAYHDDSQVVEAVTRKWYSDRPRVEVELGEVG